MFLKEFISKIIAQLFLSEKILKKKLFTYSMQSDKYLNLN